MGSTKKLQGKFVKLNAKSPVYFIYNFPGDKPLIRYTGKFVTSLFAMIKFDLYYHN